MKQDMSNKITYTSHRINRLLAIERPQECRSSLPGNCEFATGKLTVPSGGTISLLPVGSDSTCLQPSVSTSQSVRHFVRFALLALLLLMVGVNGAWGQDYSGTYFLANNNNNEFLGNGNDDNFYLCPAEEYYESGTIYSTTENGMPFLTTYQYKQDVKSLWVIEKVTDPNYSNYYTLKNGGKYLTVNDNIPGINKIHRRKVHLETVETLSDRNYFTIVQKDIKDGVKGFTIGCVDKYNAGGNKYLNPAGGNANQLTHSTEDHGGIVGFYKEGSANLSSDARGSVWFFEIPKPSISQGNDKTISITHQFGSDVNIYYTLDGTNPTTSSTQFTGTAFLPEISVSQIKAIAVSKNTDYPVNSAVAIYNLTPCPIPTICFDNATKKITISSAVSGATIYYTTGTEDATDPTFSTGTNGVTPVTIPNVNSKTTVKAFSAKQGYTPSSIITQTVDKVATPVFDTSSGNSVIITCATEDATIYYTDDDSEPSTSWSVYHRPLTDGISGKAFRAFATKANNITSDVAGPSDIITLKCAIPTIKRGRGNTFTLSCNFPIEGVTIYYTTSGVDLVANPTSGTAYTVGSEVPFSGTSVTVKAIAVAENYNNSALAERTITEALVGAGTAADPYLIDSSGDFDQFVIKANGTGSGDYYKVTDDFSVGSATAITRDFMGFFDGDFHTIKGLKHPLFNSINGGIVKNVALDPGTDATVSGNGAICNEADGSAKIYNCGVLSGTISGSGNVGGLVGHIISGSSVRVVNCYNFATVSGGSTMAGIVGNNEGTVGDVRIALCMMYGDMPGGISPVYAGNHMSNSKNFTEYNYYRSKANLTYTIYNDQLAIDKDEYLTRFPFYRHILNTHRELAAYFLFDDYADNHVDEIGHWALKEDVASYPIIEAWVKNRKNTPTEDNNNLPNTTDDYAGKLLTAMGNSGYLNVSIKIGSNNYSANLPITDMDTLRYDYTYGKVILPFANEFEENTDYSKICTGWKITAVGSSMSASVTNYNFADRNNPQKDIYDEDTNPFIYAQGGYYVVPTGVSSIAIEANYATAYYLSDATYDVGYDANYVNPTELGGSTPTTFHDQPVYNNLATALAAMDAASTPHTQAIVLVGNYHFPTEIPPNKDTNPISSYTDKAFTLMSIDADNNQEPDYGFYSNNMLDRPAIAPVRFDFLPIISLGMAAKVNGSNYYPGLPIWKSRGWYEQTETTISIMNQFELDSGNFTLNESDAANKGKGKNPCIINGGYFVQMVRSNKGNCSKVSYFKIGGNAYIKEFYPGSHSGSSKTTTIVPVNVTGGQVDECFMTGYNSNATAVGSDIRFWCSGGKIGKFLGAYMDKPKETSSKEGNVNMTAKVDHALIGRFFGGGTSQNAAITGDITVTINNSKVDFYCGGPEFGNMSSGKQVRTTANNTRFGEYYGAGFGGTAITYSPKDGTPGIGRTVTFSGYTFDASRLTNSGSLGLATCYKFEFLMHSNNKTQVVARFITGYADFNLATTGNVTNDLTGCTIEKDFYGAGCQGKVDGTVTSTLTGCTIMGSAFGGGYKAESNEVKVYPAAAPTLSVYNGETGIFSEFGTTTPVTFNWVQGDGGNPVADEGNSKLKTSANVTMSELGNVTDSISLTIDGGWVGGTSEGQTPAVAATETSEAIPAGGSVYGGGNESKSLNNATVTITGDAVIYGDVFGGGNKADVVGNAKVIIGDSSTESETGGGD